MILSHTQFNLSVISTIISCRGKPQIEHGSKKRENKKKI